MANPVESTIDNEHWFGFIANQVSNDLQTLHILFRAQGARPGFEGRVSLCFKPLCFRPEIFPMWPSDIATQRWKRPEYGLYKIVLLYYG